MKKFLSFMLSTLLIVALIPSSLKVEAAEADTLYCAETEYAIYESLAEAFEKTEHALYDDYGYISTKPVEIGKIGTVNLKYTASAAGIYSFVLVYSAKTGSAKRKVGLSVNNGAVKNVDLEYTESWDAFAEYKTTITLKSGENVLTLATPEDYDNSEVKTPNLYAVKLSLIKAEKTVEKGSGKQVKNADGTITYTIVKPDTLWSLAKIFKVTVEDIVAANPKVIKDANLIHTGNQIIIPAK